MILGIRTDGTDSILMLADGDKTHNETWQSGRQLSNHLLSKIEDLLAEHNSELQQLDGIVVFKGTGSFTGLRIGVTVANSLAYAIPCPIVGSDGDDWFKSGRQRLSKNHNDKQVTPEYGGEANVTKPKK